MYILNLIYYGFMLSIPLTLLYNIIGSILLIVNILDYYDFLKMLCFSVIITHLEFKTDYVKNRLLKLYNYHILDLYNSEKKINKLKN
jgi:hypothetical protein